MDRTPGKRALAGGYTHKAKKFKQLTEDAKPHNEERQARLREEEAKAVAARQIADGVCVTSIIMNALRGQDLHTRRALVVSAGENMCDPRNRPRHLIGDGRVAKRHQLALGDLTAQLATNTIFWLVPRATVSSMIGGQFTALPTDELKSA